MSVLAVHHRDSAVVKLNFSEERPAKPPRLQLAKTPTTDPSLSAVQTHHSSGFFHCFG